MATDTPNSALRAGVAEALNAITGLRAFAEPQDQLTPPTAMVLSPTQEYDITLGDPGSSSVPLEVLLLVAPRQSGLPRAYRQLDEYTAPAGERSVKAAVESDRTLGGRVHTVHVPRYRDAGVIAWMDVPFIGCRFEVELWP